MHQDRLAVAHRRGPTSQTGTLRGLFVFSVLLLLVESAEQDTKKKQCARLPLGCQRQETNAAEKIAEEGVLLHAD